jgi:hypothetical protein
MRPVLGQKAAQAFPGQVESVFFFHSFNFYKAAESCIKILFLAHISQQGHFSLSISSIRNVSCHFGYNDLPGCF